MIDRKERTLELYKSTGAQLRLLKKIMHQTVIDASKLLYAQEGDRLLERLIATVNSICSRVEDHMFADYPELPDSYLHVFYGDLDGKPSNETDREIQQLAKEAAEACARRI